MIDPRVGSAWPTARTELYCVIGSPIRHSLSPVLHNAAFAAAQLDAVYLAFEPTSDRLGHFLETAFDIGIRGISVTMPFKAAVARHAVSQSEEVVRLGAANTLVRTDEGYHALSTDGDGLIHALRGSFGIELRDLRCVIVGAGGAAGAAALALDRAGAEVVVVARREAAARTLATRVGGRCRAGELSDISDAPLVINATPVGMDGTEGAGALVFEPELLSPVSLYYDMVYVPEVTPQLARHRSRGGRGASGRSMLAGQAAVAVGIWTGLPAPFGVMDRVLVEALGA